MSNQPIFQRAVLLGYCFVFFPVFLFSATLELKVQIPKEALTSPVYLRVHTYTRSLVQKTELETQTSANGRFTVEIKPGLYSLEVLHGNMQPARHFIHVTEEDETIKAQVTLVKYTMPVKKVATVHLVPFVGEDSVHVKQEKGILMTFNPAKGKWETPFALLPANTQSFFFQVNDHQVIRTPQDYRCTAMDKDGNFRMTFPNLRKEETLQKGKKDDQSEEIEKTEDTVVVFNPVPYREWTGKTEWTVTERNKVIEEVLKQALDLKKDPYYQKKRQGMEDVKQGLTPDFQGFESARQIALIKVKALKDQLPNVLKPLLWADETELTTFNLNEHASFQKNKSVKSEETRKTHQERLRLLQEADIHSPYLDYYAYSIAINLYNNYWEAASGEVALDQDMLGVAEDMKYKARTESKNENLRAHFQLDYLKELARYNEEKARLAMEDFEKTFKESFYYTSHKSEIQALQFKLNLDKGKATAPDFSIKTLDGKTITRESLKGKYVFLDFWGTWCPPCRDEIPNVVSLRHAFPEDKLVVLGIACNDTSGKVIAMITEKGINYPNALSDGAIQQAFGVTKYPSTFLLDPKGNIIAVDLRGQSLPSAVKRIISK